MTPSEPRPFPWERIPRVARARLSPLRRVARAMPSARLPEQALFELLGTTVSFELAPLEHCPPGGLASALADPLAAIVLEHAGGGLGARAALELDPRMAALVCDRALGGEGDDPAVPVGPLSDVERGALAYVAARTVSAAGLPFVVRGVATSAGTLAGALGDAGAVVLPASVWLGEARGLARMWLPERALDAALRTTAAAPVSAALLALPLTALVEAAWGTIADHELRGLRPGDALLLDESWLRPAANGAFAGEVRARLAGGHAFRVRCALAPEALRITKIEVGLAPGAKEGTKMEPQTKTDATSRANDVPLEVSIEIARFTLPLAEVASLAVGEVLATGRGIGERVTLRANGQAVATGELVEVEGEVGMRILSLAD